jgi:hypothetical protein
MEWENYYEKEKVLLIHQQHSQYILNLMKKIFFQEIRF